MANRAHFSRCVSGQSAISRCGLSEIDWKLPSWLQREFRPHDQNTSQAVSILPPKLMAKTPCRSPKPGSWSKLLRLQRPGIVCARASSGLAVFSAGDRMRIVYEDLARAAGTSEFHGLVPGARSGAPHGVSSFLTAGDLPEVSERCALKVSREAKGRGPHRAAAATEAGDPHGVQADAACPILPAMDRRPTALLPTSGDHPRPCMEARHISNHGRRCNVRSV